METVQTSPIRRRLRIALSVFVLMIFVMTCGVIACGRALKGYTLKDAVDPSVPMLELHVAYYDPAGKPLSAQAPETPSSSPTAGTESGKSPETPASTASPTPSTCSQVVGGDVGVTKPPSTRKYAWEPTPVPCPLVAQWNVYRTPVALSVYVNDGVSLASWYTKNPEIAAFRASTVWRGLLQQLAIVLRVRAEDLELTDWKGEFLQPLLEEALSADAIVHYDAVHGAGGFVFSFARDKAPLLGKALPILVRTTASNGYKIPEMIEPVVQLRIQGARLYVTQVGDRVFVASGLEGLINVSTQELSSPQGRVGTITAVVRAESYLDKLLPVAIGAKTWPLTASFDLTESKSALSEALVPHARVFGAFAPKTDVGVAASVPRNVLGAAVLSAHVPLDKPVAQWAIPATPPSAPGGLALIWDLSGSKGEFNVGIAVPHASSQGEDAPDAADFLAEYGVSDTCAGGAIWLGASSDELLGRMRESCDHQNSSLLDVKGDGIPSIGDSQIALFLNTGVALSELYKLGGGEPSDSDLEKPELPLLKKLAQDVATTAARLPMIGLAGHIAPADAVVRLVGFTAPGGA